MIKLLVYGEKKGRNIGYVEVKHPYPEYLSSNGKILKLIKNA